MPIEKLKPSFHFEAERLEQLKQIAPEAFADGKINWETLQEALGEYLEDETYNAEHFGLFWPGKRDARKMASIPSQGTLIPCPGEGIEEENTKNIFIEGENLEVLKLLQKSYSERIKMIYIDPPYNTGNDFIYDDDFTESIEEYLRRTGQLDEEAKSISTNTKADGRFHSKWLSMMYPRLRLSRNLLKEEGVIFVSIDDNEVHNLRQLMNEVFGEENFICEFIWKSRQNKDNRNTTGVSIDHEYILCYSKNNEDKRIRGSMRRLEQYKNPDNDSRGSWTSGNMVGLLPEKLRPNCHYDLINPNTKINYGKPKMGWRYDKNTMNRLISEDRILWPSNEDGRPRRKVFLNELADNFTGYSSILGEDVYTRDGSQEIENLFGFKAFDFPKPTTLIRELIIQGCDKDDIVLDFFAGSGTTAHSILNLNIEDGIKRSFISVQLPEILDEKSLSYDNGYRKISDITLDRIKKVSSQIIETNIDKGTKVFKLNYSNFKKWDNYTGTDIKELETLFENNSTPLVEDWKPENLLTEVMLIEGFPLDSKLKVVESYKHNKVTEVVSDFCEHKLLVCLDDKIDDKTIQSLQLDDKDIFICLDTAITDKDKVTLQDKGLIKTI